MVIFQLHMKGPSAIGDCFRCASKEVFRTREAAKAYIPKFESLCSDETLLFYVVRDDECPWEVKVLELELED